MSKEKKENTEDREDETPTVLFCPKCDSTDITVINVHCICNSCSYQWS